MSLAGHQINSIDANFYLQKSLEIFDKKSADKIWSKKDKGVESAGQKTWDVINRRSPTLQMFTGKRQIN